MNKQLQIQNKFRFVSRFMLMMTAALLVSSQAIASSMLQKNVTIELKNATVKVVLEEIQKQTGLSFFYNQKELEGFPTKNISFKNVSVDTILKHLFDGSNFLYDLTGNNILISKKKTQSTQSSANQRTIIKGKVIGENKLPISGAMILIEGSQTGAISDNNGDFSVASPKSVGSINISCVGYVQQNIKFNGNSEILVKLISDILKVDDITVVAYGTRKSRQVVGAISSVKAEDLKELPTHSLESLLQGRMSGVEVNNISGSPGGGGSIVAIRGYNSLFSEGESLDRQYGTPLYVVDGVPIHAFSSPITGANTLSDLDPTMIESIEVLKDAASAAIYGSRAGNGVILITTKKGKQGRALFSANASTSISYLPKTPIQVGGKDERNYYMKSLMNTFSAYYDYNTGSYKIPQSYREAIQNYAYYTYFSQKSDALPVMQDSLNSFYNNSTDWYRYAYQTAKVYNANIQTSGGNDIIQYMIGAGFVNEEGIMINSSFTRANIISNISVKPTKNMRIDSRTYLAFSDRSRGGNRSGGDNKVEGVTVDPTHESSLRPGAGFVKDNILEALNNIIESNNSYSARMSLVGEYEIIKGLKLNVSGSLDFNQQNLNNFEPSTMDRLNHLSISKGEIGRSITLMNENVLNYNFKINADHNFDLLAGISFHRSQSHSNSGQGIGGPNDYIQYVGSGWGDRNGLVNIGKDHVSSAFRYGSNMEEEQLNSMFGRIAYNYKEKYLLEATVRRDGSSKFGENVRWATFPSVAAGWAFSEEKFMKSLYWLNFGKIRASWGTSGQTFSQNYLAHGLFIADASSLDGMVGMTPGTDGGVLNKELTWEKSSQYDIGIDLNMFNGRLDLKADYYYKVTSAQLSRINNPGNIYFYSFQWQNAMQTSNEGLELEAQVAILRETAVKWRVRVNGSRNWNKFKKSHNGMDVNQYVLGKPLYQISVFKDDGFYNNLADVPKYYGTDGRVKPLYENQESNIFLPGERRILDINGDGVINGDDRIYAASPLPIAHGGIASELKWRNLDLNLHFNYSIGRNIMKIYDDFKLASGASGNALLVDPDKVNSWTGPNSNPDYPFQMDHGIVGHSTQYSGAFESSIEKVNLIRLKQLTIGYNLEERIVKKLRLKSLRVFLTAENLFLLTNYSGIDPEIVNIMDGTDNLRSYPLPRKFTIGLTVNF